jgi:hypothetical protein
MLNKKIAYIIQGKKTNLKYLYATKFSMRKYKINFNTIRMNNISLKFSSDNSYLTDSVVENTSKNIKKDHEANMNIPF